MLLPTLVFETSDCVLRLTNFNVFQIFNLQKGALLDISPLNFPTRSSLAFLSSSGFKIPLTIQKSSVNYGAKPYES